MDKVNNEGKTIREALEELDDLNPFIMSVEERLVLLKKLKGRPGETKESIEKARVKSYIAQFDKLAIIKKTIADQ